MLFCRLDIDLTIPSTPPHPSPCSPLGPGPGTIGPGPRAWTNEAGPRPPRSGEIPLHHTVTHEVCCVTGGAPPPGPSQKVGCLPAASRGTGGGIVEEWWNRGDWGDWGEQGEKAPWEPNGWPMGTHGALPNSGALPDIGALLGVGALPGIGASPVIGALPGVGALTGVGCMPDIGCMPDRRSMSSSVSMPSSGSTPTSRMHA